MSHSSRIQSKFKTDSPLKTAIISHPLKKEQNLETYTQFIGFKFLPAVDYTKHLSPLLCYGYNHRDSLNTKTVLQVFFFTFYMISSFSTNTLTSTFCTEYARYTHVCGKIYLYPLKLPDLHRHLHSYWRLDYPGFFWNVCLWTRCIALGCQMHISLPPVPLIPASPVLIFYFSVSST